MSRTYRHLCITIHQAITAVRTCLHDDTGTTAPEYMLVLGFISMTCAMAFGTSGRCIAITNMSSDLADKIRP